MSGCERPFRSLWEDARTLLVAPLVQTLLKRYYVPKGVPVIRGSNMGQMGRYIGGEYAYVSPEKSDALASNQVVPGDIVVTQRGTMGQVSIVPSGQYDRYVISQSQMGVRVEGSDTLFIFYLLKSRAS